MLFRLVETDVAGAELVVHAFVEALGIELDVSVCHRPLAELHPGTGAEDALAIDRHPGLKVVENLSFFLVIGAIGT